MEGSSGLLNGTGVCTGVEVLTRVRLNTGIGALTRVCFNTGIGVLARVGCPGVAAHVANGTLARKCARSASFVHRIDGGASSSYDWWGRQQS